jgi:hypothetical protein
VVSPAQRKADEDQLPEVVEDDGSKTSQDHFAPKLIVIHETPFFEMEKGFTSIDESPFYGVTMT